ncbi:MAG: hypothetical protein ABI552_12010 [Casimicrobiaceae bacterium]
MDSSIPAKGTIHARDNVAPLSIGVLSAPNALVAASAIATPGKRNVVLFIRDDRP